MQTAPVLLHIFNRPDMVKQVMEQVRMARPSRLYISSNAPRPGYAGEEVMVMENRKIADQINWDCEVRTLFQEKNLGTRYAMYEAISWFFRNEPEGIILEEDCLPNQSFFRFCTAMLAHYRDDARIMHIAGTNQQFGKKIGKASYYFSVFPAIWGWASWRRVWDVYDIRMKMLPEFERQKLLKNAFFDDLVVEELYKALRATSEDRNMTWDRHLGLSVIAHNGLCVNPNVNMVSKLGVRKVGEAQLESVVSNIPRVEMTEPIDHPVFFIPDRKADINHITWAHEDTDTNQKQFYARHLKKPLFTRLAQLIREKKPSWLNH